MFVSCIYCIKTTTSSGFCLFKGTVHPKIKNIYFPFQSRLFLCELQSFGDVCLRSNVMEPDVTPQKIHSKESNSNFSLQKSFKRLIHRPCCEQFHVGALFSQPYHHAEGNMQLLISTEGSWLWQLSQFAKLASHHHFKKTQQQQVFPEITTM